MAGDTDVSTATACGLLSSLPSTRLGAIAVSVNCWSTGWPTIREGTWLKVTCASTSRAAVNKVANIRTDLNCFIFEFAGDARGKAPFSLITHSLLLCSLCQPGL